MKQSVLLSRKRTGRQKAHRCPPGLGRVPECIFKQSPFIPSSEVPSHSDNCVLGLGSNQIFHWLFLRPWTSTTTDVPADSATLSSQKLYWKTASVLHTVSLQDDAANRIISSSPQGMRVSRAPAENRSPTPAVHTTGEKSLSKLERACLAVFPLDY